VFAPLPPHPNKAYVNRLLGGLASSPDGNMENAPIAADDFTKSLLVTLFPNWPDFCQLTTIAQDQVSSTATNGTMDR
jgi:hypothetical protein